MATLRNPLFRNPTLTGDDFEDMRVANMGDLRKGWRSGRLGTEANYALAGLASARAEGNAAEAARLNSQVEGLRQQQARYAPRVGRVENIEGVGDAVDWAQSMVGQGAASMLDPVAAAAGATALGTGLSFIPNPIAKAAGAGLRTVGAFAAPYAINQRQLKGEFYGQAMEDPEIMRNYTAQELNTRANLQGAGAAALDSVVPAIIGRGLGGAGLRAGISRTGVGARTVGGMAMEGATEVGQGEITRAGLTDLNPDRVDENVGLDRLNEFAGGAIGAGPFTAAGAIADAGFRRTGAIADGTANLVKDSAGTVRDLYRDSPVETAVNKAGGKAKDLFKRGKDTVIDLRSGDVTASDIKTALKDKTQGAIDTLQQTLDERSVLSGDSLGSIDPADPAYESKFLAEDNRRTELIASKLESMTDDPVAQELYDRAFSQEGMTPADRVPILDEAAAYLLQKDDIGRLADKANRSASVAGKAAGYAGKLAGRLASASWDAAKGAAKGFNEGRKLNAQTWTADDADAELAARKPAAERAMSLERAKNFAAFLEDGVRSREQRYRIAVPNTDTSRLDVDSLAKYMGDIGYEIADLAEQWTPLMNQRPTREQDQERSEQANTAFRERARQTGTGDTSTGPKSLLPQTGAPNFEALTLALNRIATDLNSAYGPEAASVLQSIRQMAAPEAAPFFYYLEEQLAVVQSKRGAAATAQLRRSAQDKLVAAVDPATGNRLLRNGINIFKPEGKRQLLGMVEAILANRVPPAFEKELAKVLGRDVLDGMLEAIDTDTQMFRAENPDVLVDDGGREVNNTESGVEVSEDGDVVESVKRESNMIEKQAQRAVDTRSGGKLYGFYGMDKPRTDKDRDPFRSDKKVTASQLAAWDESVRARQAEGLEPDWDQDPRANLRPRLIPLTGQNADRAVANMERRLKVDRTPERMLEMLRAEVGKKDVSPNRATRSIAAVEQRMRKAAEGDENAKAWLDAATEAFFVNRAGGWRVTVKSAADVMREQADGPVRPERYLSLYRDYMRQDAARNEQSAATARKNALAAKTEEEAAKHLAAAARYDESAAEANADARAASNALLDTMDHAQSEKDGVSRSMRTGSEPRLQVKQRARAYFEENGMVVAERLSDRDPGVLSAEDIIELNKQGERVAALANRDGPGIMNRANILVFKSDLANNKDGEVYIPASRLVYLARQRRMMSEPMDFEGSGPVQSNRAKNEQYIKDLLDGVGMMLASGHASELPTFYNEGGRVVSFNDGLPDDLMLATNTVGRLAYGRQMKTASITRMAAIAGPADPRRVEANRVRDSEDDSTPVPDDEIFVADSRIEQEPSEIVTPKNRKIAKTGQRAVFPSLNTTVERGEEGGGRFDGRVITDNRTDRKAPERSSRSNVTPLDSFRPQKQDEIRDEFAEQRRQSVTEGATTKGAKTTAFKKGRMDSDGVALGERLAGQLIEDPAEGAEQVLNWMRMASRPEYDGKGGVVGGLHLAMPAAVALNKDMMRSYAEDDLPGLMQMRKDLALVIKNANATPAMKIALMRAMAPADQASKITSANFQKMLDAIQGEAPNLGNVQQVSVLTRAQINAASDKALAAYRDSLAKTAGKRQAPAQAPAVSPAKPASAKEAGAPVGKPQTSRSGTGNRKLNAQDPTDSARPATPEEIKQAKDFIRKVLGPQIKVDFKELTGYSGEWIEADNVIEIAMTSAPGAMQVAYHEALHAFFSKFAKDNNDAREALQALVMDPELNERTVALLDKYPAALEQYRNSAEERLAYMFQFWMAGKIKLPGEAPKTLFGKLKAFLARVAGRVTDSERATAILEAFRDGKFAGGPSVAGKVIRGAVEKGTWTPRRLKKIDKVLQKARSLVLPAQTIMNTSDSPTARMLAKQFWTNPGEAEHGTDAEGYLNAKLRHATQYKNLLSEAIRGLSNDDLLEVTKALQMEQDNLDQIAYKPNRVAAKKIRALLQRFRQYMVEDSGVEMGDRGPFYFPRVWNPDMLMGKAGEFTDMLKAKYDDILSAGVTASDNKLTKDDVAQRILLALVNNSVSADNHMGPSREDGVLAPFFQQKEVRELAWLKSEDAEPFLEKNAITTLTQYFHNGARSAEYVSRFGNNGEKLKASLEMTKEELKRAAKRKASEGLFDSEKAAFEWADRQYEQIMTSVGAMEGTLGKDISSLWRDTSAWATVYQNIRLLPLTLFASVVDPLGMVARGASMKEAFESFMKGMTEVVRSWGDMFRGEASERTMDKWDKLAMDAGIIDAAMFGHFVSDEYSSVYMSKGAKKVNDMFFQLNGMEGWNRGMRAGATKAAVLFIQRHKSLPDAHSARWLQELGLKPADIHLDADGNLITDWRALAAATNMEQAAAQRQIGKLHYALSRWVHGAVITPNAAQRPGWSSDPHYSMFFHLKQFMYSFHMTILKRAVNEMGEGNMAPIAAFMWYVPVMIASDITKGLIQGGGELPPYMQGMDPGDWVLHGIERAGLLGVGTIGVDAGQDIFSLGGPMVEQIVDSFAQPINESFLESLPANPLYKNWVQ